MSFAKDEFVVLQRAGSNDTVVVLCKENISPRLRATGLMEWSDGDSRIVHTSNIVRKATYQESIDWCMLRIAYAEKLIAETYQIKTRIEQIAEKVIAETDQVKPNSEQ